MHCARGSLRPGDPEWEKLGHLRVHHEASHRGRHEGRDARGKKIKGDYKFTDEFPMADGFEENVEFFTLTYESAMRVSSNREFAKIAPFLWLRAGSRGRRIDDISIGWDVADAYGVIANLDLSETFIKAVEAQDGLTHAFIVTDEDRLFEAMVRQLPEHVEPVRLYSSYLRNFEIEAGRATPMKFTLKPYQRTALEDMLAALDRAKTINERETTPTSVSLSATTGAGKTVIASAVIESLFYGNDDFDFEPDDGAVVIWFSDDPNLNEQTRFRIMEASDKVVSTDLVIIEPPFSKPKLDAGQGVLPQHAEVVEVVPADPRSRGR